MTYHQIILMPNSHNIRTTVVYQIQNFMRVKKRRSHFCLEQTAEKMERTRDISPNSSSSSNSQLYDKKYVQNIIEGSSGMLPLLYEAINETIAEKTARGKEISELLRHLDIDPKSMSRETQDLWTKAAAIMAREGLSNLDEVTLTLHMHRKTRETINKAREERKLKERFNRLQESQSDVLEKNNQAQDSVDMLQKVVESNNEHHVNSITNAVKLNDYKELIEKIEESLEILGVNNYFPEKILDKFKNYLELLEELHKVEESLGKYSDLPPNLSEARIKLAEKEKHLKDLEHAIFEKMK